MRTGAHTSHLTFDWHEIFTQTDTLLHRATNSRPQYRGLELHSQNIIVMFTIAHISHYTFDCLGASEQTEYYHLTEQQNFFYVCD